MRILIEEAIFEFSWGEARRQGGYGCGSGRRRRGEEGQWSANGIGQHSNDHRCDSAPAGFISGGRCNRRSGWAASGEDQDETEGGEVKRFHG